MINGIVDGISLALNAEFGDRYKIYTESVEQGLTEPCFLITRLNHTSDVFLGNRYWKTNQFAVQYFPEGVDPANECSEVNDRLFECLEIIHMTDNDLIRAEQMVGSISDNVLTFTLNFNFYADKPTEDITMEDIEINGGVK